MRLSRILIGVLIVLFVGLGVGVVVFLNPSRDAPPRTYPSTAAQAADRHAGYYRQSDEEIRLVLPGVYEGYRLYRTDSLRSDFYDFAQEAMSSEGTKSGTGTLIFDRSGFRIERADGGRIRGEKIRPQPYTVRDIAIDRHGLQLSGWLFEPRNARNVGIVIVHGSGSSNRENAWYVTLADRLARAGAFVVLPDKRGSGRSGGHWWHAEFNLLADDAAAWLDWLHLAKPGLGHAGYVGVSQGGRVAPIAQIRHRNADFIAILSTAATSLNEQVRHEITADAMAKGAPRWLARSIAPLFAERVRKRRPDWWGIVGATDPIAEWQAANLPLFIAYGDMDEHDNVPVSRSVALIKAAPGLRQQAEVHVYAGVGHGYFHESERSILPRFFHDLASWLNLNAEAASTPFMPSN